MESHHIPQNSERKGNEYFTHGLATYDDTNNEHAFRLKYTLVSVSIVNRSRLFYGALFTKFVWNGFTVVCFFFLFLVCLKGAWNKRKPFPFSDNVMDVNLRVLRAAHLILYHIQQNIFYFETLKLLFLLSIIHKQCFLSFSHSLCPCVSVPVHHCLHNKACGSFSFSFFDVLRLNARMKSTLIC